MKLYYKLIWDVKNPWPHIKKMYACSFYITIIYNNRFLSFDSDRTCVYVMHVHAYSLSALFLYVNNIYWKYISLLIKSFSSAFIERKSIMTLRNFYVCDKEHKTCCCKTFVLESFCCRIFVIFFSVCLTIISTVEEKMVGRVTEHIRLYS